MTCDGEFIVDNNFTSSPHPLIVFGRDVFVFVKAKNLSISICIVIKNIFQWMQLNHSDCFHEAMSCQAGQVYN